MKFRDQKDPKAKKNYHLLAVNTNNKNESQSDKALGHFSKKHFYLNKENQQG